MGCNSVEQVSVIGAAKIKLAGGKTERLDTGSL
jgi:hypothetical protein